MRIAGFDALDLVAGLLIVIGGGAVMLGSTAYPIGHLTRMGPGYLPMVTGFILVVLGLGLVLDSRVVRNTLPEIRLKAMVAIFASLLWWALTIERFGLVPSTFGLVVIASLAQDRPSVLKIVATATFLVAFAVVVFIYGLSIPVDAIRY